MKKNTLYIISFFLFFYKSYSQKTCCSYIVGEISEENEVKKNYNDYFINVIFDSIKINKFNPDSIKEGNGIFFSSFDFLGGYNAANDIYDVILSSGEIFNFDKGNRVIFSNILSYFYKECKKNNVFLNKINDTLYSSINKLLNPDIGTFFQLYLNADKIFKSNIPLVVELSCNLSASIVRMRYKYLDFNMYAIRREPVMLNCEDYEKYNKCIKKKYGIKEPSQEIDRVYGVYEKNYVFKKVKLILLIDIIELEFMNNQGEFIKVYPLKE